MNMTPRGTAFDHLRGSSHESTFFIVTTLASLAFFCCSTFAQTRPATQPTVGDNLPPGWEEIDQRVIFFTVQLASVETSLDAVNKALALAETNQSAKKQEAENDQHRNDAMDLNGGGPVPWQNFYGKTAERFFYHPDRQTNVSITGAQNAAPSPQEPSQLNMPGPASLRPPQFDYIYRANENAQKRADAEVANLAETSMRCSSAADSWKPSRARCGQKSRFRRSLRGNSVQSRFFDTSLKLTAPMTFQIRGSKRYELRWNLCEPLRGAFQMPRMWWTMIRGRLSRRSVMCASTPMLN
jgi:hypothetical protein